MWDTPRPMQRTASSGGDVLTVWIHALDAQNTDAGHAQVDVAQGVLQRADAAGRLDADARADLAHHELHVRERGAAGSKARGGLDKVRTDLAGDGAEAALLRVGEVAVLKDDLGENALFPAEGDDGGHLPLHVVQVSGLELRQVHDVVDLVRAVLDGQARLQELDVDARLPEREADGRADVHGRAAQELLDPAHGRGVDGRHGEPIASAVRAKGCKVRGRGVRAQERVVKVLGQLRCIHGEILPFSPPQRNNSTVKMFRSPR